MSWKIGLVLSSALLFCLAIIVIGLYVSRIAPIGSAFSAKTVCSGLFVSGMPLEKIMSEEIAVYLPDPRMARVEVDQTKKMVTASFLGIAPRSAIFRDGLGCTLLAGHDEAALRSQSNGLDVGTPITDDSLVSPVYYSEVDYLTTGIDTERLDSALTRAFSEPDPNRLRSTRAVVVVYNGQIVGERYAPGISHDTPLPGWSMTKSVTNALVGILVGKGRLSLDQPIDLDLWTESDDPRRAITLDDLMHMSSGLQFDETYESMASDVVQMLYTSDDAAAFAAALPLQHEPGSQWQYSSGTTNIISKVVRDAIGGSTADYFAFPHRELFDKIGMSTAVIEPDASGTYVGSSFMYASARDWARFGMLYLQDGVWEGERILPEGWVTYSTTPAPVAPHGQYGAQFWLNGGPTTDPLDRPWPTLPPDTFMMRGHDGQSVTIIPSLNTIIVRLGLSHEDTSWNQEEFLNDILSALPEDCAPVDTLIEEECTI